MWRRTQQRFPRRIRIAYRFTDGGYRSPEIPLLLDLPSRDVCIGARHIHQRKNSGVIDQSRIYFLRRSTCCSFPRNRRADVPEDRGGGLICGPRGGIARAYLTNFIYIPGIGRTIKSGWPFNLEKAERFGGEWQHVRQ